MLDRLLGETTLNDVPLLFSGRPVGARAVLTTIATSMITIAGIVFSMTIVSLQLAPSQLGLRLPRTFLRDRGNQTVLGTFVGIYLYCILVLPSVDTTVDPVFVPRLAVTFAILLALVGLAMLVYYIDHVAQSIHANAVIQSVADELESVIDDLFPEDVGAKTDYRDEGDVLATVSVEGLKPQQAESLWSGYVMPSTSRATVWSRTPIDNQTLGRIRRCFALGPHRTTLQDLNFSFDQLAEMADRALSPEINDPNTTFYCIDRIGSSLVRLVSRPKPSSVQRDQDGVARLIARPARIEDVLGGPIDLVARCAVTHAIVSIGLMEMLRLAHKATAREDDRATRRASCRWLANESIRLHHQSQDRDRLAAVSSWASDTS